MKLYEIKQINPRNNVGDTPESIKKSYEEAKESPEYEDLLKVAKDVSTKVQQRHGTFAFKKQFDIETESRINPFTKKRMIDSKPNNYTYTITSTGYLRQEDDDQRFGRTEGHGYHHPYRTEQLSDDLVESYKILFKQLTKMKHRTKLSSKTIYNCRDQGLTSLEGIAKAIPNAESIDLRDNQIKTGGLGLLLIKGLSKYSIKYDYKDQKFMEIIVDYFGKGKRGLIDCQTELIKAGFKEHAKI